jgi:branched-subunit amino acid ABC-type transport system permease component
VQFALNASAYFAIVTLVSIAFFFQYRLFRYFDLSLGVTFLVGAYMFSALVDKQVPEWAALVFAVTSATICGTFFYICLIQFLVKLETPPLGLTLCAFGVYIVGVNSIVLFFGDELIRINNLSLSSSVSLIDVVASVSQIIELIAAASSFVVVWILLARTATGRAFRAFGDNPKLAREIGLSGEIPVVAVTALGAALVGFTGVVVAADVGVRPSTAFVYVVPGLAAVLAFGAKDLRGTLAGAAFVAGIGEASTFAFGQQWREFGIYLSVAFALAVRMQLGSSR